MRVKLFHITKDGSTLEVYKDGERYDIEITTTDFGEEVLSYISLEKKEFEQLTQEALMSKENKNIEWCAHCDNEVELEQHLEEQICPSCGEKILNCSYCMVVLGNECKPQEICNEKKEV